MTSDTHTHTHTHTEGVLIDPPVVGERCPASSPVAHLLCLLNGLLVCLQASRGSMPGVHFYALQPTSYSPNLLQPMPRLRTTSRRLAQADLKILLSALAEVDLINQGHMLMASPPPDIKAWRPAILCAL